MGVELKVTIKVPGLWDYEVYGSGVVTEIFKKEGAEVKKGELICLITAAKTRVEVTSPSDGKIAKMLVKEGAEVAPEDIIAEIETSSADG